MENHSSSHEYIWILNKLANRLKWSEVETNGKNSYQINLKFNSEWLYKGC